MADLIKPQVGATVQAAAKRDVATSFGLLYWMANAGTILPAWWSPARDTRLRQFWMSCDHFAGAMYIIGAKLASVPFRIEPRDMSIKAYHRQADYYNQLLYEGIQFGEGWHSFWRRSFNDYHTQDNGFYAEVIGDGDPSGPIKGPVLGLAQLDASRCTRTSNPLYPVLYQDTDSKRYKFHYSRVMFASQMPSPSADMNGIGFCWLSRAINKCQELVDQTVFKQEKLGSRPPRQIIFGKGMTADEITAAVKVSQETMDNAGLSRFSKTMVLGVTDTQADLSILDLASVPDGFNEEVSTLQGMAVIALAGGFPLRWIWPAATTGATRADALFQHIAGAGGGAAEHLQMMQTLIGGSTRGERHSLGKVLPPTLRIVFDYQDDEEDRMAAEVRRLRADMRRINLETGMTTVRLERERMLADGEINEAQFAAMELEDGRLPSGDDILTLFAEPGDLGDLVNLGLSNPLLVTQNQPGMVLPAIERKRAEVLAVSGRAGTKAEKERALWALKALEHLESLYQDKLEEELAQEEEQPATMSEGVGGGEDETANQLQQRPATRPLRRFRQRRV